MPASRNSEPRESTQTKVLEDTSRHRQVFLSLTALRRQTEAMAQVELNSNN